MIGNVRCTCQSKLMQIVFPSISPTVSLAANYNATVDLPNTNCYYKVGQAGITKYVDGCYNNVKLTIPLD